MLSSGYVEEVTEGADDHKRKGVNYVPHHGVYHPRKPNKIRVVFNCASKFQGVALNDCLRCGPDLTSSIVGVLLRFRQFQVAFMADIEAMFYRVIVPEHQRDLLRFLWWDDITPDSVRNPQDLRIFRLKVHLFGATSSPSIANLTLRHSASEAYRSGRADNRVLNAVHRNFYVDDCLKSAPTVKEATEIAHGLIQACQYGGFNLGKFVSTSLDVLRSLQPDQLAKDLVHIDLDEQKTDPLGSLQERALGVAWNIVTDCFVFRLGSQITEGDVTNVTRRQVLSRLSQVYDPLGFAAPVVIVARIQFRQLTALQKYGWDEPLSEVEAKRWAQWLIELRHLEDVAVPCWIGLGVSGATYELHVFCDASNDAYAVAAYLRVSMEGSKPAQVTFIVGKARVTPPKVVTIPRLELTAAKLAAEMACSLQQELEVKVGRRVMWSDSQTVLKYLANQTKRFHTFVANRINCILNLTKVEDWRHIPTAQNPADAGSRGFPSQMLQQSAWLQGPTFLQDEEASWPARQELVSNEIDESDPEVKNQATCTTTVSESVPVAFVEQWAAHYSDVWRFKRAGAVMLRMSEALRTRKRLPGGPFRTDELKAAEIALIKWLQRKTWPKEWAQLNQGKRTHMRSPLYTLTPTKENDVIVMNSRTREKLPVMPQGNFAALLAREAHEHQGHQGTQATLAALQKRYWVIGGRKVVKGVIRECSACQRRNATPSWRPMAALPIQRLESNYPFETTGVDCFGPFYVTRTGNDKVKAYGVIFVCAATRAIHLELADSLDISSFLNALRRFVARRGHVKRLVSDHGTNFKGADRIITREVKKQVQRHQRSPETLIEMRQRGVNWTFNPPTASHYGGFYERLIRSVRSVLAALINPRARPLTSALMQTLLCECESILNSRPLTTVSTDPADLTPLTPNCFLLGHQNGPRPPPGDFKTTAAALRNRWKLIQHLASQFWRRWTLEYLSLLQKRTKWLYAKGRQLEQNDVVLIADPVTPRAYWRLGRIAKTHASTDGEIRVVTVQTAKGELTRPVNKVCLLETASEKE